MRGFTKKQNNQRYYLHRKVRQKNTAKLDVKQRTLFVPMDFQPDDHKHEYKLAKVFGYVLQTEFN